MPTKNERRAYMEGRRGWSTQRPADCPADLNGYLSLGFPRDDLERLYMDHYVRGYNDAYRGHPSNP